MSTMRHCAIGTAIAFGTVVALSAGCSGTAGESSAELVAQAAVTSTDSGVDSGNADSGHADADSGANQCSSTTPRYIVHIDKLTNCVNLTEPGIGEWRATPI